MTDLKYNTDFSFLTIVFPKGTASAIVRQVVGAGAWSAVMLNARSTLIKDKWYQMFMPSISPEQEVAEMLVPNNFVDEVMNMAVVSGKLHRFGSGAIYCLPCERAWGPFKPHPGHEISSGNEGKMSFKKDMTGIFCIAQKGKSEEIARAALNMGSPGPTIVFGRGRGIRERLGILRIAVDPEKEFIRVVVDSTDAEQVFAAMVTAGKLDLPGRGFIYMMPVKKGLINIQSVAGVNRHSASIQQIIKTIDDIKGNAEWRMQASVSDGTVLGNKKFLAGLMRLTFMVERGRGESLTKAAMDAGAPGASITYGREIAVKEQEKTSGIRISREKEIVEMIVSPAKVDEIVSRITIKAEEEKTDDLYIYTIPVTKALTYLG